MSEKLKPYKKTIKMFPNKFSWTCLTIFRLALPYCVRIIFNVFFQPGKRQVIILMMDHLRNHCEDNENFMKESADGGTENLQ
jgi:hypothetical protein